MARIQPKKMTMKKKRNNVDKANWQKKKRKIINLFDGH